MHISSLGHDYFLHEPERHRLVGRRSGRTFRLADRLQVQVIKVDLEARRAGLRPVPQADIPTVWSVLKRRGYLLLAIIALLYYLFEGYTPSTAAFWSIIYLACLVVIFDEESRRPWVFTLMPVLWLAWYLVPGFGVIPALSGSLITTAPSF